MLSIFCFSSALFLYPAQSPVFICPLIPNFFIIELKLSLVLYTRLWSLFSLLLHLCFPPPFQRQFVHPLRDLVPVIHVSTQLTFGRPGFILSLLGPRVHFAFAYLKSRKCPFRESSSPPWNYVSRIRRQIPCNLSCMI